MPVEKHHKMLSIENLRHTEYYGMQEILDNLYSRSKNGEIFTELMELILSRENKYRRILNLNATQLKKLNKYRTAIGLQEII